MSYPPRLMKKFFYNEGAEEAIETKVDSDEKLAPALPPRGRIHTAWLEQDYDIEPRERYSAALASPVRKPEHYNTTLRSWSSNHYAIDPDNTAQIAETVTEMEMFRTRPDGSFSNPLRPRTYEEIVEITPPVQTRPITTKPSYFQRMTGVMFGNWRRRITTVTITALVIGSVVGAYLGLSSASKSSQQCKYGTDVDTTFNELNTTLSGVDNTLTIPGLDPATCMFISNVVNNTVQALRMGGMNCWQNVQTALMPLASAGMVALSIANIQQIINSVKQYCVATTPALTSTAMTPTTPTPSMIKTTTNTMQAGTTALTTASATPVTKTSTITSSTPTTLQTTTMSLVTASTGTTSTLAPSTMMTVPTGTTIITTLEPTLTTTLTVSSNTPTTVTTTSTSTTPTTTTTLSTTTGTTTHTLPGGVQAEYAIPTAGSGSLGITAGPDGNVWFTEWGGNKIGKITASGVITEYAVPTANSNPYCITTGPDGNVWFTEIGGNKIGKITTSGVITEYALPTGGNPLGITTGPDGNVWFTEHNGNKIGKITASGVITEYVIPTAGSQPYGITLGPDENVWFTESQGNKIGKITSSGVITEYVIPTAGSAPDGITAGPDGNVWFTEYNGNKIGVI